MKKVILFFASVLAMSCNSKNETKTIVEKQSAAAVAELIPQAMIDDKGQVMAQMTFPSDWKLHNEPGKAAFTGPDGIVVSNTPIRNFMYATDEMAQQIYRQNGGKLRRPVSGAEIIRQDFVPIAEKEGSKLIRVYDAPEIAKSDGKVQDMMYRIGPSYAKYYAVVSEWKDRSGNPYAIILHVNVNEMGNSVMWNYYGQCLDAPKDKYDSAKATLINGLASLEYNPRYFDKFNQNEMNRESSSWAAHNQKMNAQQRQFDAQQAAFKQKNDAISQSITANYNNQDAASDRNHNRFLNYVKDENTVVNPADGERYQVQSGSNQYYINENGQYIGTNDPNYDPNRNQGAVNHTWNEAEITD